MTKAPPWTDCDRTVDISDIWVDEIDLINEEDTEVTAYLMADTDGQLEVVGIHVHDTSGITYHDREWTRNVLGMAAIWRIEQCEMEAA